MSAQQVRTLYASMPARLDPSTGGAADMTDVKLEPQDTKAKPGKDV